jgi:radical SAM superfamily enzyme YgiQ (UPF0313 family)
MNSENRQRVLLVVLPYYWQIFGDSMVRAAVSEGYMVLSVGVLAAAVRARGHDARILDLNLVRDPATCFLKYLADYRPRVVGITFTTPLVRLAASYAALLKEQLPHCTVVCGGPHPSIRAEEILRETKFDVAVQGEGDHSFVEIVEGKPFEEIDGISFMRNGKCVATKPRGVFWKLDELPMPAYDLYETNRYNHPRVVARRNPVAAMETSRGCFGGCTFCESRRTKYRTKSADRIVAEMEYALSLGYREIHLVDDLFTANLKRAKEVCRQIIDRKLDISWYPRGGIRVDGVDQEIFDLMKRAGVWHIPFGIESGNQGVLDKAQKEVTLEEVRSAIRMAKKAGMETEGYFMFGLEGETEQSMKETIDFSLSLDLDYAKFAITIPLPGAVLFKDWDRRGLIKTKDWTKYTFATPPEEIYTHPTLDPKLIYKYYHLAPRKFYLRPTYIYRRFIRGVRTGQLLDDIKTFFRINWFANTRLDMMPNS